MVVLQLQIIGIAFYRSKRLQKSSMLSSQVLYSLGFLLAGYCLGFVLLSLERFLRTDISSLFPNENLYVQGWYIFGIAGFGTCLILERNFQSSVRVPYLFSLLSFLFIILSLLNWDNPAFDLFYVIIFLLVNSFVISYWIRLYRRISKEIQKTLIELLVGFSLFILNFLFLNRDLTAVVQEEIVYIFLYMCQFCGLLFIFHALIHLKTLDDADWRSGINEIYLISRETNHTILYRNFINPENLGGETYGSSISAIEELINTLDSHDSESQQIRSIERGEKTLILQYFHNLIGVLAVSNKFLVHEKILTRILTEFEYEYTYLIRQNKLESNKKLYTTEFLQRIYEIIYG